MEQNPKVGAATGRYMYMEGESFIASLHNLWQSATFNGYIGNDATIYRIKAISQAGGFDKRMKGACEDIDLIRRIKACGWIFSVNEKAKFYHFCRQTWKELWSEYVWYGEGGYYLVKKTRRKISWRQIPIITFVGGVKVAFMAYKMMKKKKSFLIPFLLVFENLAWWFGFIKAHFYGY